MLGRKVDRLTREIVCTPTHRRSATEQSPGKHPLPARIIQIADAWVAMTARQSYQSPIGADEASRRLRQGAGAQFDRDLVAKFLEKREEIVN